MAGPTRQRRDRSLPHVRHHGRLRAIPRHFVDSSKSKVLGYTIEWGRQRATIPKSFHPDYPDMVPIIEEITAGAARLLRGGRLQGCRALTEPPPESLVSRDFSC